jgi:hypothetical protein
MMARGTWQGSGTWQTSGPDLGPLAAVAGAVLLVLGAGAWMAPRLAWLAGITAGCVVLSVVLALTVVPRLARWSDEKDAAAYADQRPAWLTAQAAPPVAPPQAPAIEQHLHLHIHDADATRAAAIIRNAIEGAR